MLDLIITDCRVAGHDHLVDIGIRRGLTAAIGTDLPQASTTLSAAGQLVAPGLVDSHLHLDKSRILDRYSGHDGTLSSAIRQTALLKRSFTEEDVYERAELTLRECIAHGTTTIRTHVEVDEVVELRAFHALQRLAKAYAGYVDLQLCVFAQEGLTEDGQELLLRAMAEGAHAIGGAPYADPNPHAQLDFVFEVAEKFGCPIDLHLDLDESTDGMLLDEVCRRTIRAGQEGRVTVGHVTQLSFVAPERHDELCALVADAGIAVTVLPATDLFLMGRAASHAKPRGVVDLRPLLDLGVTCSLATNNVLNAFTPYGDGSLIRMANLYANITHGAGEELERLFELISTSPARLVLGRDDVGLAVGAPADLVCLPAASAADAVARSTPPLWGLKGGVQTFSRPAAELSLVPVPG